MERVKCFGTDAAVADGAWMRNRCRLAAKPGVLSDRSGFCPARSGKRRYATFKCMLPGPRRSTAEVSKPVPAIEANLIKANLKEEVQP